MRKAGSLILALFVTLALGGLVSTAQAAPVVDQYTEQLPSPGGPVPVDPTNPGQPASVPVSNPGTGDSGSTAAGETAVDNGTASDPSGEAGNGGDGNGSKPAEGAGQEANGAEGDTDDSAGVFTTSGDDGGDGMGWLFPVGLLLVVLAVIGIALTRRTRHNPATR